MIPSPLRRWTAPQKNLAFSQASKDSASSACDIFGVLVNGSSGTQSRVAADPHKGVKKMGAKASATQGTPNIPKAGSPAKPTPTPPPPRTAPPTATTTAPPVKSIAAPKTPPKEKAKATTGAGGDPRPLIEVEREALKFKTYDCERCNTIVFVGQHVCFGCNLRLRKTANFSSASRRFLAVSRKNLLRDVCRTTNLKFTELTARDIRPTKDVTGKLPKSPEAAALERAKNHLVKAKQKGFQTMRSATTRTPSSRPT